MSKRKRNPGWCGPGRPVLEPNAAGVDVGAREMYVAVPPERDAEPVRIFGTFTSDLQALVKWLQQCGMTTVAMESTGVYWIPLYQMLEEAGIRPCLVVSDHPKTYFFELWPGRGGGDDAARAGRTG